MRYHPTHAAERVRRTLSWQARSLIAAASVTALAGGGVAMATAASAAPAGGGTVVYSDTSLQVNLLHDTCPNVPGPVTLAAVSSSSGKSFTVTATGADSVQQQSDTTSTPGGPHVQVSNNSNSQLVYTATGTSATTETDNIVVDETYAAGCVVADSFSVSQMHGAWNPLPMPGSVVEDLGGHLDRVYNPGEVTFTNTDAISPLTFALADKPTGLNFASPNLVVAGSTAAPGTYSDVSVFSVDANGATMTGSFELVVAATKTVVQNDETGTIVDFSGKCLDVRNAFGHAAAGEHLQVWTCGVLGSEDQVFTLSRSNHTLTYGGLCVTESGHNSPAVLESCGGGSNQSVAYTNGHYRFASGEVLDVSGFGKTNGTSVLVYAFNGGANQGFSRPA